MINMHNNILLCLVIDTSDLKKCLSIILLILINIQTYVGKKISTNFYNNYKINIIFNM